MGLKLNITPSGSSSALTMTFCEATDTTATYEGSTLTLVNINFNKQMYQPGEINARIQFTPSLELSKVSALLNAQVSLQSGSDTIASNYYVHELIPETSKTEISKGKRTNTLYVEFKIYSPDKLLTLDRRSRAFTAKRLARDILTTETDAITLPYSDKKLSTLLEIQPQNKLYYPIYKKNADGTYELDSNRHKIINHIDGCIHPYLVQYDESFYDMLIRTANRWGEFVYFEGGKLIFGRKASTNSESISAGYTIAYAPQTNSNIRDIVSNDEYLEYILEDDYLHHSGDLFSTPPDDKYGHKVVQSLLNMKGNVFDWVANNGTDALWTASQNDVYINKQNAEYNKTYFPDNSKITDTAAKERLDTQYAKVTLAKNLKEDNLEEKKKAVGDALTDVATAETTVNQKAGSGYTFRDYVKYKEVQHPDEESEALKNALNSLKKAYDDYKTVLDADQLKTMQNAEDAVNNLVEVSITYLDYCNKAIVMTPDGASDDLKSALSDLQKKYKTLEDAREALEDASKTVQIYAQFALLGELDKEEKNLSTLSSAIYKTVLDNELKAGNAMVCVDLDANYQHLCLGDTFKIDKDNYLVTRVECKVDEKDSLETTMATEQGITFVKKAELKHTKNLHFYVYGIKQTNANTASTAEFYPPMLSSGHARLVSPQIAIVKETFDPQKNARYRIQYPWQTDKEYSPWLPVSHEMMFKNAGSVWNLEKETVVLLDYKDGNVERPYIVGAMQTETNQASRATLFNKMDLCSPAGHAIRLTDGYGAGAANFIANFNPLVSWCKAWCPDGSAWHNESGSWEDYKYYEGGITLTDKYGIYSIKTSTDERNISIKSPYGDVNLNAFTGITISAPNGDVRIAGKNVSIEAGNKLKLESGKNVSNAILGQWFQAGSISPTLEGIEHTAANAAIKKAVGVLDLSLFRHVMEAFVRPVDGTLEIKSNRYMLLKAGKGEATIKSDRYKKAPTLSTGKVFDDTPKMQYIALVNAINIINSNVDNVLNTIQSKQEAMIAAKAAYAFEKTKINPAVLKAECPADGDAIETVVYNGGAPQIKNYTADDLKAAGQSDHIVASLLSVANDCSTKIYEFYKYVDDHVKHTAAGLLNKDTILATANDGVRGRYNDVVIAKAADGVNVVGQARVILQPTNFAPGANIDFSAKKKEIKQEWFRAVITSLAPGGDHAENNFPYALGQNAAADPWQTFVNNLQENSDVKTPWGKKIAEPFLKEFTQFADPVEDRLRWAAGKSGQIIFSDQPTRSVAFDPDGTPKMYENETTSIANSGLGIIKQLLHDWD